MNVSFVSMDVLEDCATGIWGPASVIDSTAQNQLPFRVENT